LVSLAQMFRVAETLIDDRRDISRYPIKDQAFVKVNIYEFSFRTSTGDDATHEVENDEGDEEEDSRRLVPIAARGSCRVNARVPRLALEHGAEAD
jgi:hypothetical protein